MKEQGIAHIFAIGAIVLVFGAVASVTYLNVTKNANNNATEKTNDAKANDSVDKPSDEETKIADAPAEDVPAEEQPAPTPAPAPAPSPAPKPQPVPLSAADCVGWIKAYVIADGGAPVSFQAPNQWQTVKTIPKGTLIEVGCEVGNTAYAPEYGLTGDAFIKMNQLSRTAP